MIAFDFEYCRPATALEAVEAYRTMSERGLRVMYYAGGTEIITFARMGQLTMDAVIDIKEIPECRAYAEREGDLAIGAAVTLDELAQSPLFPLLGIVARGIADHTARGRITLAGNVGSRMLAYRETALPLLLCDARAEVAGLAGRRSVPLADVFDGELRLAPGDLIVQFTVDRACAQWPHASVKRTKQSRVNYPIVTAAAVNDGGRLRAAFSGVCACPFRSVAIDAALSDRAAPAGQRVDTALSLLPASIVEDIESGAAYREFLFRLVLEELLVRLEWV